MNALPASRRAINGRTHGRTYYPADYDPIEVYRAPIAERIYGVLLATVIGVCLAAAAVHWLVCEVC